MPASPCSPRPQDDNGLNAQELARQIAAWKLHLPQCVWGWFDDQPLQTQCFALRGIHRIMLRGGLGSLADGDLWFATPVSEDRTTTPRANSLPVPTARELRAARNDRSDFTNADERLEIFCIEQALGRHRPH
jgi:hypothetical protein